MYTLDKYFLIYPFVIALGFVPMTPAGVGFQEFGIVRIFTNLIVVAAGPALTFGLLYGVC